MFKLPSGYNTFLRLMVENGFEHINIINLKEDDRSSEAIDGRYTIAKSFTK